MNRTEEKLNKFSYMVMKKLMQEKGIVISS